MSDAALDLLCGVLFCVTDLRLWTGEDGSRRVAFVARSPLGPIAVEDASMISSIAWAMVSIGTPPGVATLRRSVCVAANHERVVHHLQPIAPSIADLCRGQAARCPLTVPDVLPIARLFLCMPGNEVDGALHTVLGDLNVADDDVARCAQEALARGDEDGAALAALLLRCSKTQRLKIARSASGSEAKIERNSLYGKTANE